MAGSWDIVSANRALLADEQGTLRKEAELRVRAGLPESRTAPRCRRSATRRSTATLNEHAGRRRRARLPARRRAPHGARARRSSTYERERPVGDYPVLAFSVAYELELAGRGRPASSCAGIPLLARRARRRATR